MNLILSAALAAAAQPASPLWAPVAINSDGSTVYFIDRASIVATPDGRSAWSYGVSADVSMKLHVDYDCAGERHRFLEASLPAGAPADAPAATPWTRIKPGTPMHSLMRYTCADGKLDLGFGDIAIRSASPEAFAREFIARRAKQK